MPDGKELLQHFKMICITVVTNNGCADRSMNSEHLVNLTSSHCFLNYFCKNYLYAAII